MKKLQILLFCLFTAGTTLAQVTELEKQALTDLYQSTNGDNWINSWDLNADVATWHGVEIQNNTVVGLNLGFNNLKGQIPTSIENLKNLKSLYLFFNQINGTLPTSIGNLSQLEILDLNSNMLTGTIPTSIGDLTNLNELLLSSNSFSGTLPAELGSLKNLKSLVVFDNNLSGQFPETLAQMSDLNNLVLAANNFDETTMVPGVMVAKSEKQLIFNDVDLETLNTSIIATSLLNDNE